MLDEFGAADKLIEQGLRARFLQYRGRSDGVIARFDFDEISDLTNHPYRVQCEQWKLTRVLLDGLQANPNFEIAFSHALAECDQNEDGVSVVLDNNGQGVRRSARWLIGCDGASSVARTTSKIEFEGFTWNERFLVLSTPFDFAREIEDLDPVTYVADPEQWYFMLRIPDLWRVMFPIDASMSDEDAQSVDYGQYCLKRVFPEVDNYEIAHRTLYRVHQRVAKTFRSGRIFLAGDAAHINNPLGGMGMNGGIHDAMNLTGRLAAVWRGEADVAELGRYDKQRRNVTIEAVQKQTIQNKRDLEASDHAGQSEFRNRLRRTSDDRGLRREYLRRLSMLSSLERAAELG